MSNEGTLASLLESPKHGDTARVMTDSVQQGEEIPLTVRVTEMTKVVQ